MSSVSVVLREMGQVVRSLGECFGQGVRRTLGRKVSQAAKTSRRIELLIAVPININDTFDCG